MPRRKEKKDASGSGNKVKTIGKYELRESLGEGTFGKVKRGVHTETKQDVAIKIIDKEMVRQQNMGIQIKREVNIMKQIGLKEKECNVVKLYEVLASKSKIYLILELVTGGELFDKIVKEKRFNELKARRYFRQLVTTVELCHNMGVCHRDLKPENLLLDDNDNLKISDFGLSALYTSGGEDGSMLSCRAQLLHTTCGTPNYVAPEVLNDEGYDGRKADIWSMGVILYVLVVGTLPFDEISLPKLFEKIRNADFPMPSFLSPSLSSLISSILIADPKKRACISQIKTHHWFCHEESDLSNFDENEKLQSNLVLPFKDILIGNVDKNIECGSNYSEEDVISELHIDEIMMRVRQQLEKMGFKLDKSKDNLALKTTKATIITSRGMVGISVSAFDADGLTRIEFRKGKGNIMEYHSFLNELIKKRLVRWIQQ